MTEINKIFIFDIDGVLTNIETHKIEEKQLLNFIIDILKKREPVAFNTGRPLSWVKTNLITLIENEIEDKNLLTNLFAAAEKGGVWLKFDMNGNEIIKIDKNIKIPNELEQALRNLITKKFEAKIFYDNDKKTMATLQKMHNMTISDFDELHPYLDSEIDKILKELNLNKQFKYTPTTLDTDIENIKVGKDYAMGKILEWLKTKNINVKKFITFGDSKGDLDMARHLFDLGHSVEFVYVGNTELNSNEYSFQITVTSKKYDQGTLEYLKAN